MLLYDLHPLVVEQTWKRQILFLCYVQRDGDGEGMGLARRRCALLLLRLLGGRRLRVGVLRGVDRGAAAEGRAADCWFSLLCCLLLDPRRGVLPLLLLASAVAMARSAANMAAPPLLPAFSSCSACTASKARTSVPATRWTPASRAARRLLATATCGPSSSKLFRATAARSQLRRSALLFTGSPPSVALPTPARLLKGAARKRRNWAAGRSACLGLGFVWLLLLLKMLTCAMVTGLSTASRQGAPAQQFISTPAPTVAKRLLTDLVVVVAELLLLLWVLRSRARRIPLVARTQVRLSGSVGQSKGEACQAHSGL